MLWRISTDDYEKLCNRDVLGVQDIPKTHEETVSTTFKKQLKQNDKGWYKTGVMWKQSKENIQNNETVGLRSLQKKKSYHQVTKITRSVRNIW